MQRFSLVASTLMLAVACGPSTGTSGVKHDLKHAGSGGDMAGGGGDSDGGGNSDNDLSAIGGNDDFGSGDLAPIINGDAGVCAPGQTPMMCASPISPTAGCTSAEVCGNGVDDDCNGQVDEGCACTPGDVQKCFLGPPGKRGVGACTDGTQTCSGSAEFPSWGDCVGSIAPQSESCDKLDNDCNGCADDGLCCGGALDCPAPGDPRIAPVAPYTDKQLLGETFFSGSATKWTWTVEGGPCDKLFASPDFTPKLATPPQSFTLTNGNTKDATVHFTLSGDYTVTLTIVDADGNTQTCKWVQHVEGPGIRIELCWDHQGTKAQGGADLDLHVHKYDGTATKAASTWFINASGDDNPLDCYFDNCEADAYTAGSHANFGYANTTPDTNCKGSKYGSDWDTLGYCGNPRLDLDNISDVGVPENTNIDAPATSDVFRAAVHYYGQYRTVGGIPNSWTSATAVDQHPIVNIYCGGTLKATYGQAPNKIPNGFNWGSTFDTNTGGGKGMIWRVADVKATGTDAGGNTTCDVTPLHPKNATDGYWIVTDKNNTDFSY